MLSQIYVSDLALIRRLSVDMEGGFSVLTGETGAGKSLVLDSLGLFLSSSGAKDLVRRGEEKLSVSLFFTDLNEDVKKSLGDEISPEEWEEGILISRTVYANGKSVCKIGTRTVPFSLLSSVAGELIAIHGQHDTGGLLDEKKHGAYLDSALAAEGQEALETYRRIYADYRKAKTKLEDLKSAAESDGEMAPLYDFQMKEIASVAPKAGEEEELEEKLRSLQSFEKRHGALYTAHRALDGGEKGKGALFLLEAAARKLEAAGSEEDKAFSDELYEMLHRAREIRDHLSDSLSSLGGEDPEEELDRVQKRLSQLFRLKQKYKKDISEILLYYSEIREKKALTVSRKDDIKRHEKELKEKEARLLETAEKLTRFRKKAAEELEKAIHSTLSFLDMPKMRFLVEFQESSEPGPEGMEKMRFVIAANTGEGAKPLAKVASGGELSRIMLALQLKLGKAKDADTLIFDEIDTGISGATAQKIGICLKTLSERKQVLCVTHSAQVATLADEHYLVEKKEEDGRTETHLTLLSPEESLRENARLLGGKTVSGDAENAAKALQLEGLREWQQQRTNFS